MNYNKSIKLKTLCLALLFFCGCSKSAWDARIAMFQAENAMTKAGSLKAKKIPHEQRIPYYREACFAFERAYRANPAVFTLSRIRDAGDACWRIEDAERRDLFEEFEQEYARQHPKEFEYGDTDATIPE